MTNRFEYLLNNSALAKKVFSGIYKNKKTEQSYVIYSEDNEIKLIDENQYNDEGKFIGVIDRGIFLPNEL